MITGGSLVGPFFTKRAMHTTAPCTPKLLFLCVVSLLVLIAGTPGTVTAQSSNAKPHVLVIVDSGATMTHDSETNSINFLASGDDEGLYTDYLESYYGVPYLQAQLGPAYRDVLDRGSKLTQMKRALRTFFTNHRANFGFSYYEKIQLSIAYLSFIYRVKEMIDTDGDEIDDTPQPPMLDGTLPGTPLRFGDYRDARNYTPATPVFPIHFGENGDELFVELDDPFGTNTGTPAAPTVGDLRLVAFLVSSRETATAVPLAAMTPPDRRSEKMYYYPAYYWGSPEVTPEVLAALEGALTWEDVAIIFGIDTSNPSWKLTVHDYAIEDISMIGNPWGQPLGTLTDSNQIGSQILYIWEQYEIFTSGSGWVVVDAVSCPACAGPQITEVAFVQPYVVYDHDPTELTPGPNTFSSMDYLGTADCNGYLDDGSPSTPTIIPLSQPDPVTGATGDQRSEIDTYLDPQHTPVFYFPDHFPMYMPEVRELYIPYTETIPAIGRRPIKDSINEAHQYFNLIDSWPDPLLPCRSRSIILITDGNETCTNITAPCVAAANLGIPINTIYFGTTDNIQSPDLTLVECIATESGGAYFQAANEAELDAILDSLGGNLTWYPDFTITPESPFQPEPVSFNALSPDCWAGDAPSFSWQVTGATTFSSCPDADSCTIPGETLNPGVHTVTLTITDQTGEQWIVSKPMTVLVPECSASEPLIDSVWKQIALPCNPPASTPIDLFGDDGLGTYGTEWIVIERDAAGNVYQELADTDTMAQGVGYWITSITGDHGIDMWGTNADDLQPYEIAVVGDPAGRYNMVGNPFNFAVSWDQASVDVGGGTFKTVASLSELEATTILSSAKWEYNGSGYDMCDPRAVCDPVDDPVMAELDGLWVKAFTNTTLRIPPIPAKRVADRVVAPLKQSPASWYLRLSVADESGMTDQSNLLGRLDGAADGWDSLDIEEMPPFGSPYLTLVFPQPTWPGSAWAYTTDYRELRSGAGGEWAFEVRSDAVREVTLSWQPGGDDTSILSRAQLVDHANGLTIDPALASSYTVTLAAESHAFSWVVNSIPQVAAGPDLTAVVDVALALTAGFNDEDTGDSHTSTISWGDGATDEGLVDPGAGTASGSHTYTKTGDHTIEVCVVDQQGAGDCDTLAVTVLLTSELFSDGFETGDTAQWSTAVR